MGTAIAAFAKALAAKPDRAERTNMLGLLAGRKVQTAGGSGGVS